jgi:hypothetical protein
VGQTVFGAKQQALMGTNCKKNERKKDEGLAKNVGEGY